MTVDDTLLDDMNRFLDLFSPKVKNGVEILDARVAGGMTFHISANTKLKTFEPRISQRTLNKEDRSVPRISTAQTLNGCLSGYSSAISDWEYNDVSGRSAWVGGWKIYGFNFDLAPNKTILGDAEYSEEVWLVGFNKEHRQYRAEVVGDLFFTSIAREATKQKDGVRRLTVKAYVNVRENYLLPLNLVTVLRPGFYEVWYNDYYQAMNIHSAQNLTVKPISGSEYGTAKELGAGLLNY